MESDKYQDAIDQMEEIVDDLNDMLESDDLDVAEFEKKLSEGEEIAGDTEFKQSEDILNDEDLSEDEQQKLYDRANQVRDDLVEAASQFMKEVMAQDMTEELELV